MPASPYSSVQQSREQLAARLIEVMRDAGIASGREMARRLGWQESKVSRIIRAVTPPSEADVRAWCQACEAADEIPGIVASLRLAEGTYVEWRRMERAGLRAAQESVRPLFERTERFRSYSPTIISGMIQTRAYTTAVLRNTQRRRGLADDVDAAVEVRMLRQQLLNTQEKTFAFLLEEQVLGTRIADDDVMTGQLAHLLTLLAVPNIRLGIIPSSARRERQPTEGFWIYDTAQVSVELVGAYLTVTQPREVSLYEQAFAELSALAVYGASARNLIARAVQALG
ncbi:MAG: helix-turn-helix transcriptional regulator [Catenulispora sp.]|nr:helix-turn-helix transcriptional regulator [Catenulispora sp.]NUR57261.1 helix-turn-helix transcriptional regulator [Catenulispora sp.]